MDVVSNQLVRFALFRFGGVGNFFDGSGLSYRVDLDFGCRSWIVTRSWFLGSVVAFVVQFLEFE